MKMLYDLQDKLFEELEELSKKQNMTGADLERVHILTDTIKNIDKICMLEEDDGYSQNGDWEAQMRGRYEHDSSYEGGESYGRGSSYANRGKHYVRGHYSRDDDYAMRRGRADYSRTGRGYSTDGEAMEHLKRLRDKAVSEKDRKDIERIMDMLR